MEKASGSRNDSSGSREQPPQTPLGCGPDAQTSGTSITLNISTTTGGTFSVTVESHASVEYLKKTIAKKLKVAKDRICLLHRERELQDGTLKDNGLIDGSKIILIPNVETGLLAQRPENTVMQALESLNDNQVNDFLSGKTPLNLSMRLGDHMMLIQLQLSTVNPSSPSHAATRSKNAFKSKVCTSNGTGTASASSAASTSASSPSTSNNCSINETISAANRLSRSNSIDNMDSNSNSNSSVASTGLITADKKSSFTAAAAASSTSASTSTAAAAGRSKDLHISKKEYEHIQNIVNAWNTIEMDDNDDDEEMPQLDKEAEQSPIKSLSNLVSSPIKATPLKCMQPIVVYSQSSSSSSSPQPSTSAASAATNSNTNDINLTNSSAMCPDPITAKLTSCLCKRLDANSNSNNGCDTNCQLRQDQRPTPSIISAMEKSDSDGIGVKSKRSVDDLAAVAADVIASAIASEVMKKIELSGDGPSNEPPKSSILHRTTNNPITKSKHRRDLRRSKSSDNIRSAAASAAAQAAAAATSTSTMTNSELYRMPSTSFITPSKVASFASTAAASTPPDTPPEAGVSSTDARTLAEASRNLTQTLRKLSKEVFTNKIDVAQDDGQQRKSSSGCIGGSSGGSGSGATGAVIESMKSHGKGIYSGTFSGTLNPALQDRYGRPKRDISTVIHILNDLLSATPQYSRGARISFEPTTTTTATANGGRTGKSSTRHRHNAQKNSCKCTSALNNQSNCTYGECNGHTSSMTESNIHQQGPFCEKHRPTTSASSSLSTATPAILNNSITSNCRCMKKGSGSSSNSMHNQHHQQQQQHQQHIYQKIDESSNDSVNANDCQCQFRSFDPTSPDDEIAMDTTTPPPTPLPSSPQTVLITSSPSLSPTSLLSSSISLKNPQNMMCIKCSSIEMENSKTKNKLEQLRMVMQQKKERREARKLRLSPYGGGGAGAAGRLIGNGNGGTNQTIGNAATAATTNSTTISAAAATTTTCPSNDEVVAAAAAANHHVEEVDTAA